MGWWASNSNLTLCHNSYRISTKTQQKKVASKLNNFSNSSKANALRKCSWRTPCRV